MTVRKKVILDVDTGVDDAMAIAYAIHSPELEVLGVTTCFGNTSVEDAARNSIHILNLLDAQIPVAIGAHKPIYRDHLKAKATHVHGEDGLGDTGHPFLAGEPIDQHAVDFMIEKIKEFPNEVTLILVGSSTNLAHAIIKEPEIIGLIQEVVIMGGAVTVSGNVTPFAEANIYTDPEAADLVFRSGLPIRLVGLDVTMKTLLPRENLEVWRERNTQLSNFFADMTEFYMNFYLRRFDMGGCSLHDPLAVGVVIDPSFVKCKPLNVRVNLEANDEIGKTFVSDDSSYPPNVQVCLEVDSERFLQHFLNRVV